MGYIDQLESQSRLSRPTGMELGLPKGGAYASYFPAWETQTPQHQAPNPYAVIQSAFRTNEFVYSIIIKRAEAEAQGRFRVSVAGDELEEIKKHDLTKLIRKPNKNMTEEDLIQIRRISLDLVGFAAFEIEYNMIGEPMRLWFMRPDWCSFIRGQQDPLKYIRYQPYGLPPQDVPLVDDGGRQKILFFSNPEDFDPLYPGVKFYSPAMHCLPQIEVDNAMTFFLADFVKHGAKPAGILSVAQTIDQNTADDFSRRWLENHGGADKWSQPIVLGLGTIYSTVQMNFKDMMFESLDGRTESRICNTFQMDVIVADARVGQNISSYNNKEQAERNWRYGWVASAQRKMANTIASQMLPLYEDNPDNFECDFDISKVYSMQEDRTAKWTRADMAWKDRMVKLNEARKEAGLDPVDGQEGDAYYEAVAVRPDQTINAEGELGVGNSTASTDRKTVPALPIPAENETSKNEPIADVKALESKAFKKFAANRLQAGKPSAIIEFEFKHHSAEEIQFLLMQAGIIPGAAQVIEGMRAALDMGMPK